MKRFEQTTPMSTLGFGHATRSFHTDARSRAQEVGDPLEIAADFMLTFSELFDDHIDSFCATGPVLTHPPSAVSLWRLLERHSDAFEATLWLSLSRFAGSSIPPRASFVGRLCVDLLLSLLHGPRSAPMELIVARSRELDERGWTRAIAALNTFWVELDDGRAWPRAEICAHACASVASIEPVWLLATSDLRTRLRSENARPDDPAMRRAARYWSLLRKLLEVIMDERGDLRLFCEYIVAIWSEFRVAGSGVEQGRGIYELFLLEVLALIMQCWNIEASPQLLPPPLAERQRQSRRKRIQRARLRVLTAWQPDSCEHWQNVRLPRLLQLGHSRMDD